MGILRDAESFARKMYSINDPKHRYPHARAVMKRAMEISKRLRGVDYELLKLAIIFHDIDYTSYDSHVEASISVARRFLQSRSYPAGRIEKVAAIMLAHSSPHRKKFGDTSILEGKIIYDADKSIFITNKETFEKYYPRLYLDVTKGFVKKY